MTVDEAAFQMELLGHSFFLFLNADANQFNVLYRRDDGDYGLIDPVVG
jgi:putative sigma-54 modulation protein